MSTSTATTAVFRRFEGRERKFCLRIGEIMLRLSMHRFYASDIWATLRLGLIGGGESRTDADVLVGNVEDSPIADYLQLAADILSAAVSGVEAPGKPMAEGSPSAPETSPPSMASAGLSDGATPTSTG